jgi:hypothetical protein
MPEPPICRLVGWAKAAEAFELIIGVQPAFAHATAADKPLLLQAETSTFKVQMRSDPPGDLRISPSRPFFVLARCAIPPSEEVGKGAKFMAQDTCNHCGSGDSHNGRLLQLPKAQSALPEG